MYLCQIAILIKRKLTVISLSFLKVARVLITFAAAFRRIPKSKMIKKEEEQHQTRQHHSEYEHLFDISLEIKEEDSKVRDSELQLLSRTWGYIS